MTTRILTLWGVRFLCLFMIFNSHFRVAGCSDNKNFVNIISVSLKSKESSSWTVLKTGEFTPVHRDHSHWVIANLGITLMHSNLFGHLEFASHLPWHIAYYWNQYCHSFGMLFFVIAWFLCIFLNGMLQFIVFTAMWEFLETQFNNAMNLLWHSMETPLLESKLCFQNINRHFVSSDKLGYHIIFYLYAIDQSQLERMRFNFDPICWHWICHSFRDKIMLSNRMVSEAETFKWMFSLKSYLMSYVLIAVLRIYLLLMTTEILILSVWFPINFRVKCPECSDI